MRLLLRISLLVFASVAYGVFEFYNQRATLHHSLEASYKMAIFVSAAGILSGTVYLICRK